MTSGVHSPPKAVSPWMTVEEFERLPNVPGQKHELVDGVVVTAPPPGYEHGSVAHLIAMIVGAFVRQHQLGVMFAAETGFRIGERTVRAPDVAFLRNARAPKGRVSGYFQGAPDLAVEVISPSDQFSQVMGKVRDWLAGGAAQVWVVDPEARTITVYTPGAQPVTVLTTEQTITGGELLPGFAASVAEFFPAYPTTETASETTEKA